MRTLVIVLLICVAGLVSQNCFSQEDPKTFTLNGILKECNIAFNLPKGFKEFEGLHGYSCGDGEIYNALTYSIINNDSFVVIGIYIMPAPKQPLLDQMNANYRTSFDLNYLKNAKHQADTVKHKLVYYPTAAAKQKFNADGAVQYYRHCPDGYNGRYHHMKFVTGLKKARAEFGLIYFYDKTKEKQVDKLIKETAGMIRFNDRPDK